jgi:hypothetical protein
VLEAEWNERLRALHAAQQEFEQRRAQTNKELDDEQRKQILALATDFAKLWNDEKTPQRERKRMVRLLLEDITLRKTDAIHVGVRFRGGATQTLTLPLTAPEPSRVRRTSRQAIARVDMLLDDHTDGEIALILNQGGFLSGAGRPFDGVMVQKLRAKYGLKPRYERLREGGLLTLREIANRLGVTSQTVKTWRDHGLLRAHTYNDKHECLYEDPGNDPPLKQPGLKLLKRRSFSAVSSNRARGGAV